MTINRIAIITIDIIAIMYIDIIGIYEYERRQRQHNQTILF